MARVTAATRWPEARATHGMVASPHALASEAGLATLRRGSNAVDGLEARFDAPVAESLRGRGHDEVVVEEWSDLMGHAQVIRIEPEGFTGGSDPRADGAARGW